MLGLVTPLFIHCTHIYIVDLSLVIFFTASIAISHPTLFCTHIYIVSFSFHCLYCIGKQLMLLLQGLLLKASDCLQMLLIRGWSLNPKGFFSCKSFFDKIIDSLDFHSLRFINEFGNCTCLLKYRFYANFGQYNHVTSGICQTRGPNCNLHPQSCIISYVKGMRNPWTIFSTFSIDIVFMA